VTALVVGQPEEEAAYKHYESCLVMFVGDQV